MATPVLGRWMVVAMRSFLANVKIRNSLYNWIYFSD